MVVDFALAVESAADVQADDVVAVGYGVAVGKLVGDFAVVLLDDFQDFINVALAAAPRYQRGADVLLAECLFAVGAGDVRAFAGRQVIRVELYADFVKHEVEFVVY